ncbi:hypothetical protein E4U21_000793 [Claviceps maximensis]|nr:hypothetical protein E4U21_000793 [Claviceps maximensis]
MPQAPVDEDTMGAAHEPRQDSEGFQYLQSDSSAGMDGSWDGNQEVEHGGLRGMRRETRDKRRETSLSGTCWLG